MAAKSIDNELEQEVALQLDFLDLFDLEEIQKIQDAFALAAGVASVITSPDGRPITRPSNFSSLCKEVIQKTEKGLADCLHFHSELGRDNSDGPAIKSCPGGGLWEGCAGIRVGEKHVANWIVGQVRSDILDTEEIIGYAAEIGADEQEFRSSFEEITVMPFNRFEQVCNFLFLMADLMSKIAFQNASRASHIRQLEEADSQLIRYRDHLEEMNRDIQHLDELKTELFANTSHELKTPLYNIIGLVESLMEGGTGPLPRTAVEHLDMVVKSGRRMINLLNDSQDFSRLRHEDLRLEIKPVDIRTVAEVVFELFTPFLGTKKLKFVNRIPADVPAVAADEQRVGQIFQNMVGNIVKYSEDGTVTVSADVKGDFLLVSVFDTGSGAAEEIREHIFESFSQVDGTIESEYGGVHVGLGVSKLLVELQGGKIGVESVAGKGTGFWFTLPLASDEKVPGKYDGDDWQVDLDTGAKDIMEALSVKTESVERKAEAGVRLLVVDDEPVCRRVYSVQLSESGYLITQAVNGKEALEKIEEADKAGELFDIVLLDVVMPNMSGYEVCRILRRKYPADKLPVLMLTAKDRVEDRVAGLEAGANDYLAKPFSRHELLARIHTHVSLKNLTDERRRLESQLHRVQKMEAIGTMAGGFAHDFNNILGIILGNIELAIEDTPESSPTRFNLEEVRVASMRAKDVVKRIQSFTRQGEGEMKPVRVIPIVRESLKMLRASIPATIEINMDVTAENDMIVADPAQIHLVLVNLVNNGVFEMRETGGVLNVGVENVVIDHNEIGEYDNISPGRYVIITVRDTGKGIDPEIMDRIFDPYFTTRKIGQGSGMGLSVVRGIVGNHNGCVMAESEPGQGATFLVFFPVVEKKPDSESESGKELFAGNESILFVDDEPALARLGEIILSRLGYSVVSAAGPLKALEIFEAEPDRFDLLVTDYAMPDMSGVVLAKRIKEIRPSIPVILCTGFKEQVADEKIRTEVVSRVMIKPVDRLNLSRTVREVLDSG